MYSVLYKLRQLFTCRQIFDRCCYSSNGPILLERRGVGIWDFSCDDVFEMYQTIRFKAIKPKPIKKIITWNIQELWWHSFTSMKLFNIIDYIRRSDSDVMCLQEVFDVDTFISIISCSTIRDKYPYFLTGNMMNRLVIGENSGLLVLSNQPILFRQFTSFEQESWPDRLASKGALYFTVGKINFIVTHLQSENVPLAVEQMSYILDRSPFSDATILLGDLNIPNPFSPLAVRSNNADITHESGRTLDHIIPLHGDILFDLSVDYINIKNTSDHYPVCALIST